jgi:hypothetical protein
MSAGSTRGNWVRGTSTRSRIHQDDRPLPREVMASMGGFINPHTVPQAVFWKLAQSKPGDIDRFIKEMIETLQKLGRQRSLTIQLVEQSLNFITSLSQRVLILQKGPALRLRVADASIFPPMASRNTNAPMIMVDRRAAAFIAAGTTDMAEAEA